ncbi:hypothetical protein [Winogradskyella ursingii]|uniref:hypothetical protein n=1 Tax=Winogradskyella ursingii TaxID=2686079 RepID=UPI0015CE4F90|nr:hypothetical protein [Winogradskyella ursingii]
MKKFIFLLLLAINLTACQRDYDKKLQTYLYIPSKSSTVIQINELNDFLNGQINQEIINDIYNKELNTSFQFLKHLTPRGKLYLSFIENDQKASDYLILTQTDSTLFVRDSISNFISESFSEKDIEKVQIDTTTIYIRTLKNLFAASNSLEVIQTLKKNNKNSSLEKLIETTNSKSVASIIFRNNKSDYSKLLFNVLGDRQEVTNFTVLDLDFSDTSLKFNGVVNSKDSIKTILDCFKNTNPQKIKSIDVVSDNSSSLTALSYDNFATFKKNLDELSPTNNDTLPNFLNYTDEIALAEIQSKKVLVTHALDSNLAFEAIEDKSFHETYRDIDIYLNENNSFLASYFQPIISFSDANYFIEYNDFLIFAESTESLKSIISDVLNDKVLSKSNAFQNIQNNLSNESSLFIFKDAEALSEILNEDVKNYNANVVQFVYEKNYALVNGIFEKYKKRSANNAVEENFTTKIDADILFAPQSVKNHNSNTNEIVVQDINNVIYLISSSGNILWKKQLQSKILGKVEQIDSFKNGRLQLVFATENSVYVLDRNGKDVGEFPLKFQDKITQPLSVFDYDKRKNYRLLVTQGNNLLMYDAKGKRVTGFDYKSDGFVNSQPKHFRIGSKDYIAFTAGEKLKILNRQGNIRINVTDKFKFSDNELYLYQNKFTTTNTLGQLIQVSTSGNITTKSLSLSENHHIETTSKTLVTLNDNRLKIRSRTLDLDFGNYTSPKIFYLNDKIYVSVSDLQASKVYLFDSQAQPLPNFPVFGTAAAELQKTDGESGLELITQSDSNTVLVYKLY